MHDRVDAFGDAQRVGHLGNIRPHERLPLRGLERALVGEAQLVPAGELAAEMRADVARGAGDQYGFHILPLSRSGSGPQLVVVLTPNYFGFRFQCFAFTAPFGALPFAIAAACATVSIDWCSIAGTVSPAVCGVASTSARAARRGVGI